MPKRYSIAQARHDLAAIVHGLEQVPAVELTRRGEPVAVLLSLDEYRRLVARQFDFWSAYSAFRAQYGPEDGDLAEPLRDLRDQSSGREPAL